MIRLFRVNARATAEAMQQVLDLDRKLIGSPHYMGLAFFWHHDFRFDLRDASPAKRVLVHDAMVAAGLDPAGNSAPRGDCRKRAFARSEERHSMNTQTRLGNLALACWVARHCGSAGKWERKTNVMRAMVELRRAIKHGPRMDCSKPQREQLNRRQRRAQREGVQLWNVARPFGIESGVMKWRSVA